MNSSIEINLDRPYICPCGKNYLSYPALFTHIKSKHDGNVNFVILSLQVKLSDLKPIIKEVDHPEVNMVKNHHQKINLNKTKKFTVLYKKIL